MKNAVGRGEGRIVRAMKRLALVLLCLSPLFASAATISGRVVTCDGAPIPGVEVELSNGAVDFTTVDGRFVFDAVANHGLTISAQLGNFWTAKEDVCSAGSTETELVLAIREVGDCIPGSGWEKRHDALIAGKIMDLRGVPIAGATVSLHSVNSPSETRKAKTNRHGDFRFRRLAYDLYTVDASAAEYRAKSVRATVETCSAACNDGMLTLRLSPACPAPAN
jgi:hypothetical protein